METTTAPATMRERAREAENVLARTDHTNAVLAALATALLVAGAAGVGFTGGDATLPTKGRLLMGAALIVVAAALLVLLAAIRPRRGVPGAPLSGVPLYAGLSAGRLLALEENQKDYFTERTRTVSRIAVSKHRQQRLAIALMTVAVALMVLAVLITLT